MTVAWCCVPGPVGIDREARYDDFNHMSSCSTVYLHSYWHLLAVADRFVRLLLADRLHAEVCCMQKCILAKLCLQSVVSNKALACSSVFEASRLSESLQRRVWLRLPMDICGSSATSRPSLASLAEKNASFRCRHKRLALTEDPHVKAEGR